MWCVRDKMKHQKRKRVFMFYLINSTGRYGCPDWAPLISEHGRMRLLSYIDEREALLSGDGDEQKNERGRLLRARETLEILGRMPLETVALRQKRDDAEGLTQVRGNGGFYGWERRDCRCSATVSGWSTTSAGLFSRLPDNRDTWGLDQAAELARSGRLVGLGNLASDAGIHITLDADKAADAARMAGHLDKGRLRQHFYDPASELGEADAFAVYVMMGDGVPGYLDGRGGRARLGGARLFESEKSALSTVKARGISHVATVVQVNARITRVLDNPHVQTSEKMGDLRSAVAAMERAQLKKALEDASIEQLKERLMALDPGFVAERIPAAKKRAM